MLFYLFCMFHDYWRIIHRSQKSDGKASSGHHISEDQQSVENMRKVLLFQMTEPAKRGGRGGQPWALPIGRRGPLCRRAATW